MKPTVTQPERKRAPGAGRKRLVDGVELVHINAKVTPTQHAKYKTMGGSEWLRQQIDAAKPKPKPDS